MKRINVVNFIVLLVTTTTLTAFAYGASVGAGINSKQARDAMVGGVDALPGEFPFIAQVKDVHPLSNPTHECAAVIIDENHLVTGAQCGNLYIRDIEIVAGLYNMSDYTETRQQLRKAKRVQTHPDYDWSPVINDIAVITLQDPFVFNEFVQPLKMPVTPAAADPSEPCVTLGWSQHWESTGQIIDNPMLQKLSVNVSDFEECKEIYAEYTDLTKELMICTGSNDENNNPICSNEKGGPLICADETGEAYLTGVMSLSYNCENPEKLWPVLYTRVDGFLDFINSEVELPSSS